MAASESPDGSEPHVEGSPNSRYIRYSAVLGKGAYKTVYKAFDTEEALEVAWNKLHVDRLSEHDLEKVSNEVLLLRQVEHKNIIHFYDTWRGHDVNGNQTINFITEQMMSGTLKEYLKKAKAIKLKVIRRWCRNILEAIAYLHNQTPPIMHRDLKCDNIFINGHVGEVKIGDLGLSGVKERDKAESVIGTPEFMAPELYEESYTEKVDIYAFGMCLLEIVTMEYPYSECNNMAQIFKKVFNGERPKAFDMLVDGDVKEVIHACLQREAHRPSAVTLLDHPLFRDWEEDAGKESNLSLVVGAPHNMARAFSTTQSANAMPIGTELIDWSDPLQRSVLVSIGEVADGAQDQQVSVVAAKDNSGFYIGLEIPIRDAIKRVEFTFDPFEDSSQHIAQEMVAEFGLSNEQLGVIRAEIDRQVLMAKEQREAASRNATPQPPTRQPQIEQNPSIGHDVSSTPAMSHITPVISPSHTSPGSLSHIPSLSSTSGGQIPPSSTSGLLSTPADTPLHSTADLVPPPSVDNLPPTPVPVTSSEPLSNPLQLAVQPEKLHRTQPIQLEQTQVPTAHHNSVDVQAPLVPQHDLQTELLHTSMEVPVGTIPLHVDHSAVQGQHQELLGAREHAQHSQNLPVTNDTPLADGPLVLHEQPADLPVRIQIPVRMTDIPRNQPTQPGLSHIGSMSSTHQIVHAPSAIPIPEASLPVTNAMEVSKAKDGAVMGDVVASMANVVLENNEPINSIHVQDVSGKVNFESHHSVIDICEDTKGSNAFPTTEYNMSDSQASLPIPREQGQRIPGSRSEVAMSMHKRTGPDAELYYTPSIPHVPHSASDGQLRPLQAVHHIVMELPPRPPSTPITPEAGHHMVADGGEQRSRSPPLDSLMLQEGEVEQRPSSQPGFLPESQTYPAASSGLPTPAALQQNAPSRNRAPSTSMPTIVVVRNKKTESGGDGRQRKSNDGSSPATDGSSESYRSVYSTAGSGEHGAKIVASTARVPSPQERVPVSVPPGHTSDGKMVGRISPDPTGPVSGPVRGSSWRSAQSVETNSSMTPKNRKQEDGNDPKSDKYLTKGLKLMDLCARGRYDDVKTAFLNGASALFRDYDKRTPLHVCAGEGHGIVCSLLIENGAEISAKDRWGNTALSDAREKDHAEVVELLKRHGAEDEDINIENLELLHYCAEGDVDAVRHRMTGGAQACYADYDNRTPLHLACSEGHVELAEVLLVNGASHDVVDRKNRTPVDDAISNGRRSVLRLLKRYGAKVPNHLFETDEEQGHRLGVELIEHCASGDLVGVEEQLDYGANVNFRDYDLRTGLHLACVEGHSEIVGILLQVGAKLDARDRWGSSPLEDAVKAGFVSIVEKVQEMEMRRKEAKLMESGQLSMTSDLNGHVDDGSQKVGISLEFQQLPAGIAIPSISLSADDFAAKYTSNEESSSISKAEGVGTGAAVAEGLKTFDGGVDVNTSVDGCNIPGGRVGTEREEESFRKEFELRGGVIDGGAAIGMICQSSMSVSSISNSNGMIDTTTLPVMSGVSGAAGLTSIRGVPSETGCGTESQKCSRNALSPCRVKADIRSMVEGLFDDATRMS